MLDLSELEKNYCRKNHFLGMTHKIHSFSGVYLFFILVYLLMNFRTGFEFQLKLSTIFGLWLPEFLLLAWFYCRMVGWLMVTLGRIPASDLEYYIQWRTLYVRWYCRTPLKPMAFLLSYLLPFLLLGILPLIGFLFTAIENLFVIALFGMLLSSNHLWLVYWAWKIPAGNWILDHPTLFGFQELYKWETIIEEEK